MEDEEVPTLREGGAVSVLVSDECDRDPLLWIVGLRDAPAKI